MQCDPTIEEIEEVLNEGEGGQRRVSMDREGRVTIGPKETDPRDARIQALEISNALFSERCAEAQSYSAKLREAVEAARQSALIEATRLVCDGCRAGIPLGSYYSDEDEYREEPDWERANDGTNNYRAMAIQHGYDEGGDSLWCGALQIHRTLKALGPVPKLRAALERSR